MDELKRAYAEFMKYINTVKTAYDYDKEVMEAAARKEKDFSERYNHIVGLPQDSPKADSLATKLARELDDEVLIMKYLLKAEYIRREYK